MCLKLKSFILNNLFKEFKNVPNAEKKNFGLVLNELKVLVETKIKESKQLTSTIKSDSGVDLSKPGTATKNGSIHPLTAVKEEIISVFKRIGRFCIFCEFFNFKSAAIG